jgi:serine/threonine-protein kinase
MAKLPDMIDKYRVDALLAQGGMGEVYTAIHPTLNCKIIIKKLTLKGNRDINERFKREARLMMDFRHDQIVNMFDHFKLGTSYYIVLEFVDGISVEKMIRNCRYLNSAVAAYILLQTAEALQYAHGKKVVHRDIKPANILLSKKGEVKLADFGIASSGETEDEGLTREGMTLGTPGYMAPEQFKDTRNVDARADIYALGVMAYEMLTGKKPFPGNFSAELISKIQTGKYKNPKRLNPQIAGPLAAFIRRSMRVNPKRRFQNMGQGIKLLKRYLRGFDIDSLKGIVADAAAGREPGKPALKSSVNKSRKIVPLVLLVTAVLAGSTFLWFKGYVHELLFSRSMGSVVLTASVPDTGQSPLTVSVMAGLFRKSGDNWVPVENLPVIFIPEKIKSLHGYRSLPVYLPEGLYRCRIVMEDELYWSTFVVLPRKLQKKNPSTRRGLHISTGYPVPAKRPVTVIVQARDAVTGESLDDPSRIRILDGGEWRRLENPEMLPVGSVQTFKVECDGYDTETFKVDITGRQGVLVFKAGLVPQGADRPVFKDKKKKETK